MESIFKFQIGDEVRDIRKSSPSNEPCRNLDNKILRVDNYFADERALVVYLHDGKPYSAIIEDKWLEKVT